MRTRLREGKDQREGNIGSRKVKCEDRQNEDRKWRMWLASALMTVRVGVGI